MQHVSCYMKSVVSQRIQRFCSRQCSRQKNSVLRINPLTGKGFVCFVARVARFLGNIYITFLFQSTLNTNLLRINGFIQITHNINMIQSKMLCHKHPVFTVKCKKIGTQYHYDAKKLLIFSSYSEKTVFRYKNFVYRESVTGQRIYRFSHSRYKNDFFNLSR